MNRRAFSFLTAFAVLVWATASAVADPVETEIEAPGPKGPLKGLAMAAAKDNPPDICGLLWSRPQAAPSPI